MSPDLQHLSNGDSNCGTYLRKSESTCPKPTQSQCGWVALIPVADSSLVLFLFHADTQTWTNTHYINDPANGNSGAGIVGYWGSILDPRSNHHK